MVNVDFMMNDGDLAVYDGCSTVHDGQLMVDS